MSGFSEKTIYNTPSYYSGLTTKTVTSTKTGGATSLTFAPNQFAGGVAINGYSIVRQLQLYNNLINYVPNICTRTVGTGGAYQITAAGVFDIQVNVAMFKPSVGTIQRSGLTTNQNSTATYDQFTAASTAMNTALIAAVEADLGTTWPVNSYYELLLCNTHLSSFAWGLYFSNSSSGNIITATPSGSSQVVLIPIARFVMIKIFRLASNQILIHSA